MASFCQQSMLSRGDHPAKEMLMFAKRIHLFTLFGFKIGFDLTWLAALLIITWALAESFLPSKIAGLSKDVYWSMGLVTALGLYASVIFHELWHSIIARKYGLRIKEIRLFFLGGGAHMEEEPKSAKVEFFMAIAGPLSSIFLACVFGSLAYLFAAEGWEPWDIVLRYMKSINIIIAVFNMMPAFPMDGGRVLRSILWILKRNRLRATKSAVFLARLFWMGTPMSRYFFCTLWQPHRRNLVLYYRTFHKRCG